MAENKDHGVNSTAGQATAKATVGFRVIGGGEAAGRAGLGGHKVIRSLPCESSEKGASVAVMVIGCAPEVLRESPTFRPPVARLQMGEHTQTWVHAGLSPLLQLGGLHRTQATARAARACSLLPRGLVTCR